MKVFEVAIEMMVPKRLVVLIEASDEDSAHRLAKQQGPGLTGSVRQSEVTVLSTTTVKEKRETV